MKHVLRIAIAISLLLAGPAAQATTLQRMTLEELAAAAPAVARVRVLSGESRVDAGRIWTFTQVEAVEIYKGTLPQRFTVQLLGGRVTGLVSKVEGVPRFAPGEEAILFLAPSRAGDWTVVSWVQGTFRISPAKGKAGERVSQDTAGVSMFDPATRTFHNGGARELPLAEFKARLAQAIARSPGSAR